MNIQLELIYQLASFVKSILEDDDHYLNTLLIIIQQF